MECQIYPDGKIEWLAQQGKRQNEIWEKIKDVAYQSTFSDLFDEDNHMKEDGKEKSIVIISGVAGTGKSTLLSHYYEEIKKAKPSHWVIRINLSDHNDAILKLNVMPSNAVDFLVNQLNVIDDKSSFSRSLLRYRLEKGDRIIFLFDGFDEINDTCQEKVIQLMKAITKEKSSQLFVTTRSRMLDDLQFQLCQLAFSLENLSKNDQINHLTSY
jgi:predicted AAA+ superfamily ATPase